MTIFQLFQRTIYTLLRDISVTVYIIIQSNKLTKSRIVLFNNIKGVVGKTTLCALFANYFIEKVIPVFAMDVDLQNSVPS